MATAVAGRSFLFLLRNLGDEAFGGQQQTCDRGGVLQRGAGDFFRVHHAGFDQVGIFARGNVIAVVALAALDFFDDDRTFDASVIGQLSSREFDRALDDINADPFVVVGSLDRVNGLQTTDQRHSATRHDTFLNCGAGRVQCVFDAGLLFLHFSLGRSADVNDRHATGQLGQAFLQLLAIVIRRGLFDLTTDLIDPALNLRGLAESFDDRGVFLVHHNVLGAAEVVEVEGLQFDAEVFTDEFTAREDGNVFAHGFPAVTEAGSFNGADVQRAAEFVHHERCQRLAFDFLSDDQQGLADLRDLFEDREQVFQAADFLFVNQDVGVLQLDFHRLGVGDEVRGQVTFVELHALDHVERRVNGLGFLHRDGSVFADLVHRVGDDFADLRVPVRRDGGHLLDFLFVFDLLGNLVQVGHCGVHGFLNPALDADGVCARSDKLQAFPINGFGQHRRRGGAITRGVAGFAGDFANHLRAHVFIGVFQLDFLGDGDTIFGDRRRAKLFVDHDVATLGAEGGRDSLLEFGDAPQDRL